ncbi:mitochondrial iron-sulfur cluster biosynthesis Mge1 (co-chaperone GrpE) [Andalucia godoyi]|uniref:GrpE protein homolog n=1 Tax=Andalucia godoyi TaxID=505711 RepID=A0A8K0AIK7_ANDGO|nr:mitochondrial iron-sulfur cluster biosynthesis Mge1 (co-chaperone GrpE) [Andalucia godoyi]|eukprot:ANDGO_03771.mRNA.1 mitochondrial iron-sulfur cluster biosynthesis Mge1 (co-chaperone GrpE)
MFTVRSSSLLSASRRAVRMSVFPTRRWFSNETSTPANNDQSKPTPSSSSSSSSSSANGSANANGNGNGNGNGEVMEGLKKQLEEASAKLKECESKYLYALAETENVRTRARRDVENANKYGISKFAQSLLDVADNLQRALTAVSESDKKSSLFTGVQMTEKVLTKAFEVNGLVKMSAMGESFNPEVHQAMFEMPGDKPGTIAAVLRDGYVLHGRTIRPAQVGVIKAKD